MDYLKNGTAQSVGASATDQAVSNAIKPRDRMQALCQVVLSAVSLTTSIKFKLKDSPDGVLWSDVGDQSEVSVAAAKTAASASDVNATTNVLTSNTHGFATGEPLIYKAGTAAIGGLTDGATYFCIVASANTFKLATSQENALAGTAVDLTSTGTGTQSFYKALHEIRMVKEDATDLAQLPLNELVKVVAVTGSDDSCTVANVFWAE
jgi:hypothetical protein